MKWVLDLCSGLGGASEAFIESEIFRVVRIENNPLLKDVPHTRMLDVLEWVDWLPELIQEMGGRPVLIWASPPCLEFSFGYSAPGPKAKREGRTFEPDMSIVEAVWDIIEFAKPDWYVVENVKGAVGHFLPYFGRYKQIIGPFFLWGKFPHIDDTNIKIVAGKTQDWNIGDPLRSNKRAIVDIQVSRGLLEAVCMQTTLYQDWA